MSANKMTDITSISDLIEAEYPTLSYKWQKVPQSPASDDFVIRFQSGGADDDTAYMYAVNREYQLIYFSDSIKDVLNVSDGVERIFNDKQSIPLNDGSLRYLRVTGFSVSPPFETEGGLDAVMSILQTELRVARSQEEYEKIQNVYTRTTTKE